MRVRLPSHLVVIPLLLVGLVPLCNKGLLHAQWGSLVAAEYFFDTDPGPGGGTPLAISQGSNIILSQGISVAALSPGFHILYLRCRDEDSVWSAPKGRKFGVMPPVQGGVDFISRGEFFIDSDPGEGNGIPFRPEDGTFDSQEEGMYRYITVAESDTGMHYIYTRCLDGAGYWSPLLSDSFRVTPPGWLVACHGDVPGQQVQLAWQSFPVAVEYHIHYDSVSTGMFTNYFTVMAPETSSVVTVGLDKERYYYLTAVQTDTSTFRGLISTPIRSRVGKITRKGEQQ